MKEKRKKKLKERGVTLIALVITIIVLLILAGVALSALTGDSGILNNAESAKDKTNLANAKEQIELAVQGALTGSYAQGDGVITKDKLIAELNNIIGENNYDIDNSEKVVWTITIDNSNFKITEKGEIITLTEEEKSALKTNGIAELTVTEIESLPNKSELKENSNIKAVLTGGVVIPTGFNYVEGTKDTGVVVSVTANNVTSEFVWVPVADVNTMASKIGETENYQGKLYGDWKSTGPTEQTDWIPGTTNYREPSLVTGNDADTSAVLESVSGKKYDGAAGLYAKGGIFHNYFKDVKEFGKVMQNDFNEMVKSVDKYKGFYIGRYETSVNGTTVATTTGTKSTRPMANKTWYEMYKLQREYSNSNKLTAVQSSMIWGSQYDAMLNWGIDTKTDAAKITVTTNAPHDNSTNGTYRPGTMLNDKINNIYDLEGNVREFTLEASDINFKVLRGGSYTSNGSPVKRDFKTYYSYPNESREVSGSRLTLYIM